MPPATDGLFLAVLPEAQARPRIEGTARQLYSCHRLKGKLLAPDRYHISLFSFGEHDGLPLRLVSEVMKATTAIEVSPFDVKFDRAMSFCGSKQRPLVLCGGDGVAKLIALQHVIAVAMQRARLGRARQPFFPHMTLLYDKNGINEKSIERVGWTVTELVLIHSLLGRRQYIPLDKCFLRSHAIGRLALQAGARLSRASEIAVSGVNRMANRRSLAGTYQKVLSGQGTVAFRDFESLLEELGFAFKGQKGSHRIYFHPSVGRPFPVQPDGKEAKRYQVRQLRDMIRKYEIGFDLDG
jgi:RNA 2',3'-cyclic 3'-phosphodiesterase